MKAMVRDTYGSSDVLELRDKDIPEIEEDEVLIRVHAAGVDRGVWHVMAGLPYPILLAGYGLRAPKNPVIGSDVSGVVEAVGKDVSRFRPGDEVFGIGKGTFAEYTRAIEHKLAPKPANFTFAQAAVLAISGETALQALRDHGRVEQGQEVLILGASGGVGTYAVQIAKAFGARVTGVCSTTKVEMVRSIGADYVIDYWREDFAQGERRYDVILDIGGNSALARLRRALTPEGILIITGGEGGGRWLGGTDRQIRALLLSRFVSQKLVTFIAKENYEDMIVLKERQAYTGHRQDVPARRGPRSHSLSGGGTRSRKNRHRGVRRPRKVYAPTFGEGRLAELRGIGLTGTSSNAAHKKVRRRG